MDTKEVELEKNWQSGFTSDVTSWRKIRVNHVTASQQVYAEGGIDGSDASKTAKRRGGVIRRYHIMFESCCLLRPRIVAVQAAVLRVNTPDESQFCVGCLFKRSTGCFTLL